MNITAPNTEPSELFAHNGKVRIHYIDSADISPTDTTPLVIIPGMVNSAEQYAPAFRNYMHTRRCILVSIRGRGQSDAPEEGYTFEEQVSDIRSVVEALGLTSFHLFGHSVGGAFALGYTLQYRHDDAVIIGDYPAFYPPFSGQWADRVREAMPGIMPDAALDGLVRDVRPRNMYPSLTGKAGQVYVIYGSTEESLVEPPHLDLYRKYLDASSLFRMEGYGHDLFEPEAEPCIAVIEQILRDRKQAGTA